MNDIVRVLEELESEYNAAIIEADSAGMDISSGYYAGLAQGIMTAKIKVESLMAGF